MGTRRRPVAVFPPGAAAAVAVVAALMGPYVIGYLSLGSYDDFRDIHTGRIGKVTRIYREKWTADAFYPLGVIESWCCGYKVYLGYS